MKYKAPLTALAALSLLSPAASIYAQNESASDASSEAAQDWSKTYSISKFGGFTVGNPDAETRITEYISYTCSHCANFELTQAPILKNDHISKGKVSLEIRNSIRDPLDLTIAILARCGGKDRFFANHNLFMREQGNMINFASSLSPDDVESWNKKSISDFARDVMKSMKIDTLMMANGYSADEIEQCITDEQSQQYITQMATHATLVQRIAGTPAFAINDEYQPSIVNLESMAPYLSN